MESRVPRRRATAGIWFKLGGRASLMFGGQRGASWEKNGQGEVGRGQGPRRPLGEVGFYSQGEKKRQRQKRMTITFTC